MICAVTTPISTPRIVFFDTETTSLCRRTRRITELGLVVRDPDTPDRELSIIVSDVDLSNADRTSLKIGHFYDRHPHYNSDGTLPPETLLLSEAEAAQALEAELRGGAHIIGMVPSFDETSGYDMLYRHGLLWDAHYHLMDVENMIVGYLAARGEFLMPPWNSEELSRAIGVEPPGEADRHTAIGDARWNRDIWDALMDTAPSALPGMQPAG